MTNPDRLPLTSLDLAEDRKALLRKSFPEVFREDKIDFDALQRALGESVDPGKERFGLNWPGKAACSKLIQQASVGTLLPMREQSVDFDATENLIIEGDNLEVLKLLQKSYYGKVKMIYIDPPYNTGNEFIYPDNFHEGLQDYLKYSGQVDGEGRKQSSNSETGGRYHSNWLSMMYPRLFLARNLLREDGVIFVSINDKETHHLKSLMNEVFGEENFLATLVWDKGHSAQAGIFKVYHEYVLVYAINAALIGVPKASNSDLFEAGAMKRESPRHPSQEFDFPAGVRFDAPNGTELVGEWGGAEKVEVVSGRFVAENGKTKFPVTIKAAFTQRNQMQQYFYGDRESLIDSRGQNVAEFYFNSSGKIKIVKQRGVSTPDTTLDYGTQSAASTELAEIFGLNESPLDNPKPTTMLSDFIIWFSEPGDLILDFFAGSGTTAHAVMELNQEDNGNRKFILVQLPEPTDNPAYQTIADITRERVRRVSAKLKAAQAAPDLLSDAAASTAPDLGFKAMRLASSNFKVWDGRADQMTDVGATLKLFAEHVLPGRTAEDILHELLLKTGYPLTTPLTTLTLAGKQVFSASEGALLICLEHELSLDAIEAMVARDPWLILCLDAGFAGQDQLKANAMQTVRAHNRNRQSSMSLKVV